LDKEQLDKILTFGIQRGVSDVHFAVGYRPHFRIKGDLLSAKHPHLVPDDTVDVARLLLNNPQWDPATLVREKDFSYSMPGIGRFRVHIFIQRGSLGIVIRVIPYEVRGFDALNLPRVLADIASAKRGLILVTGPTGMGKSTTIAAMIKHINETRNAHVVTIEDPIEFLYGKGNCIISQRELGSDTASYRDALVAALRQDPDVIMVNEVRDYETCDTCLKAAETGHLVISSIHTPDVVRTVDRIQGMFPPESQETTRVRLADCLTAIVSLRLLVSKSGLGLIPAVEVLRATRTVREHIRRGELTDKLHEIMKQGKDLYSMQTFDQHLMELYEDGQLKLEVAKAAASNPEDFERGLTYE
jgi:twitching motility protein PilT